MQEKKKNLLDICACGKPETSYKGYCEECISKLKKRFDQLSDTFNRLSEDKKGFKEKDLVKAQEKLKLMKMKADQYDIKLKDCNMMNVLD